MEEGFYWIQFKELVQIALFLREDEKEKDAHDKHQGFWLITGGIEIEHGESVKVINGPLDIRV